MRYLVEIRPVQSSLASLFVGMLVLCGCCGFLGFLVSPDLRREREEQKHQLQGQREMQRNEQARAGQQAAFNVQREEHNRQAHEGTDAKADKKKTSFVIEAKDAWYVRMVGNRPTGSHDNDKKAFCVLCEYKNRDPGEGSRTVGGEVVTDNGNSYPRLLLSPVDFKFGHTSQEKLLESVWRPHHQSMLVGESGELLLVFEIPLDEKPVKLINCSPLSGELPHIDLPVRNYSVCLGGFLPVSPEEQIPILLQALSDRSLDMRIEAAKILGELGPAAKPALPALEKLLDERRLIGSGPSDASMAAREAMMKIASDELAHIEQERERKTSGPLSGEWKDKDGRRFRIDDDEMTLTIKFTGSDSFVRAMTGELTRKEGQSDSFAGTLNAQFSGRASDYSESVTAKLSKAGQLELRCPKWPDPKKFGKTKTLEVIMSRVGPVTSKSR